MDRVLTIENEEAVRMAEQLAQMTGEPVETLVMRGLADQIAQQQAQREADARASHLLAIGRRCAAKLNGPLNSADHAEIYGEDGLPA